jgi:ribonuclease BN (tRNA processing enzyme)
MVIQETFLMTQSVTGHGSVEELLKVQEEMWIHRVALTHFRENERASAITKYQWRPNIHIPVPWDCLEI